MGNLKKMTVCGMMEIKDKSINDLKNRYLEQLYDGILTLHQENPSTQGLVNYDRYNAKFGKEIQISKDTIMFETLMTDIKDGIREIRNRFKSNELNPGDELSMYMAENEMMEFFGKGEFPFLIFRIFKIGEVQYSAYTITR